MRERPFYFVVASILFFNVEIFSQIKPQCIKLPINYAAPVSFKLESNLQLKHLSKDSVPILETLKRAPAIIKARSSLFVLSPSFYSTHLSFFCNTEWKIEKITYVPLRFRLGSLDYVNYLEQKPGSRK